MTIERRSLLALLALVLVPASAEACASCMSSGDQTFNWAYYGLMATPFAILMGVGGVLTGCYLSARRRRPEPPDAIPDEEMT